MSTPIRPGDIEVLENDPFKNDLLDRKETAELLTDVVRSIEGPGVVAIDAAWGTGKTTFLKMWVQRLRNDKFTVIEFNAWKTDFANDPFLALSTELQNGLDGAETSSEAMERFRECSKKVLQHGLPDVVRLVTSGLPVLGAVAGKITEAAIETFTESRVSSYVETKEAVAAFNEALKEVALETFSGSESLPLVVVIDELDRCRPTYAVELLETAKHLFSVDHVVFVLAINRRELSHSVRSLYGVGFDADLYLRRFLDAEVRLPDPDLRQLTTTTLRATGFDSLGARIPDARELASAREVLVDILGMSSVAARTVLQELHVLGLVFGSIRERHFAFPLAAVVATVVRMHDVKIFSELARGNPTDEDVIRAIRSRCEDRTWSSCNSANLFEAAVMCIVKQQASAEVRDSRTPLLRRYTETVETSRTNSGSDLEPAEGRRLQDILDHVERMAQFGARGITFSREFDVAVARLRALSGAAQ